MILIGKGGAVHDIADVLRGEHLVVQGVAPGILIPEDRGAGVGNEVKGDVHQHEGVVEDAVGVLHELVDVPAAMDDGDEGAGDIVQLGFFGEQSRDLFDEGNVCSYRMHYHQVPLRRQRIRRHLLFRAEQEIPLGREGLFRQIWRFTNIKVVWAVGGVQLTELFQTDDLGCGTPAEDLCIGRQQIQDAFNRYFHRFLLFMYRSEQFVRFTKCNFVQTFHSLTYRYYPQMTLLLEYPNSAKKTILKKENSNFHHGSMKNFNKILQFC